jgi:hypothetical protein
VCGVCGDGRLRGVCRPIGHQTLRIYFRCDQ